MYEVKLKKFLNIETNYIDEFEALKCCVIIPTYNNSTTIGAVIEDVAKYTNNIIVVNDGSTDNTLEVLNKFKNIELISYSENKGKGYAIRKAFKFALSKNFIYAITIDSDGQHFASDLPNFINKIKEFPDSIIIGSRNLNIQNVPKKNSFANKFSNFWFTFETGLTLSDTQSGFRLYPIVRMKNFKYFTNRYEFELEILVKSAWKGITIIENPINVYYAQNEKRITHFRPFKDFFRISLLNTYFVILTLLFYKPFYFIKQLNKKSISDFYNKQILNPKESILGRTLAVMFGTFMGIIPIWGYQLITSLALAHIFKLNKIIVGVAANISIPPMIPIIIYGSYLCGEIFISDSITLEYSSNISLENIKTNLFQYIVGSFILAIVLALFSGIITYILLSLNTKKAKE